MNKIITKKNNNKIINNSKISINTKVNPYN